MPDTIIHIAILATVQRRILERAYEGVLLRSISFFFFFTVNHYFEPILITSHRHLPWTSLPVCDYTFGCVSFLYSFYLMSTLFNQFCPFWVCVEISFVLLPFVPPPFIRIFLANCLLSFFLGSLFCLFMAWVSSPFSFLDLDSLSVPTAFRRLCHCVIDPEIFGSRTYLGRVCWIIGKGHWLSRTWTEV